MGDFCHFYKFFLCTHNPESQPLRSLGDLSMNILSCLLSNWKNAECRPPVVHLPNSYPFLSHFSLFLLFFPPPHLKRVPMGFKANLPLSTWLHPPASFSLDFALPPSSHLLLSHRPLLHLPQTQAVRAGFCLFKSLKGWAYRTTWCSSPPM